MRSGASKTYAGRASKPAKGRLSTKTHRHEVHEARKRMKIKLNSVIVKDQEKALRFYIEVLGFEKNVDIPAGDYRWLTVIAPSDPDRAQLLLEPNPMPQPPHINRLSLTAAFL